MRRSAVALLFLLWGMPASATDMCAAILANGTYDKYETYTSSANYALIYNTVCKSAVETYQDATSSSGNLGVSILDVVDATLGGSTNATNYSQRRSQFCSLDFATISNRSAVMTKVETASRVIASAWEACVTKTEGFVAWTTVSKGFDAFTISMRNNGPMGVLQLFQISHPDSAIMCDGQAQNATRAKPLQFTTKEVNIGCRKPAADTVQISVDTSAGSLRPVDVAGSATVLNDLQVQLKALQAATNVVPAGTIIAWYATSGRIPDGWAVCDGSNGTPDLQHKFLRGVAAFSDVTDKPQPAGAESATIAQDPRVASDWYHGQTPWEGGPNPARGGQTISTLPPYANVIYLMKLR